jgi:Uma2 family endonuclease
MIADPKSSYLTPLEYLEWEEQQPLKYGYIDGEIYAMTGGTIPHNIIAINLATVLKGHLRGKGCKVLGSDAKVGISENGPYHYPDVTVTCDPRDKKAVQAIYHPCLIIEVLSPSTEGFDRGDKFKHYRRIDTLREYVLINSDRPNVECYHLNEREKWELTAYSAEENGVLPEEITLELKSIDLVLPLAMVYEDVEFDRSTDS